jgi:hypothetical protein
MDRLSYGELGWSNFRLFAWHTKHESGRLKKIAQVYPKTNRNAIDSHQTQFPKAVRAGLFKSKSHRVGATSPTENRSQIKTRPTAEIH